MNEKTTEAIIGTTTVVGITILIFGVFYPIIFAIYFTYIGLRALYAMLIEREPLCGPSIAVLGIIGPLGVIAEIADNLKHKRQAKEILKALAINNNETEEGK